MFANLLLVTPLLFLLLETAMHEDQPCPSYVHMSENICPKSVRMYGHENIPFEYRNKRFLLAYGPVTIYKGSRAAANQHETTRIRKTIPHTPGSTSTTIGHQRLDTTYIYSQTMKSYILEYGT